MNSIKAVATGAGWPIHSMSIIYPFNQHTPETMLFCKKFIHIFSPLGCLSCGDWILPHLLSKRGPVNSWEDGIHPGSFVYFLENLGGNHTLQISNGNEWEYMAGWWLSHLLLWKIWARQLGLLFPIYGKIKNVPNHQPDGGGQYSGRYRMSSFLGGCIVFTFWILQHVFLNNTLSCSWWNPYYPHSLGWYGYGSIPMKIPFLGGWTSIYQLFWCSPGVQGFDTLPYPSSWQLDGKTSISVFMMVTPSLFFGEWTPIPIIGRFN